MELNTKIAPWYINGEYVPPEKAFLPLDSPLVQWGVGVFSTGKIVNGVFLGGKLHVERVLHQAHRIGIDTPDEEELQERIQDWLSFFKDIKTPIRAKIILSPGPHVYFLAYLFTESPKTLVTLAVHPSGFVPKRGIWSQIKMNSYAEYRLLHMKAQQEGRDDLLLHDERRRVVETTKAAFWFLVDDTLCYPDPTLGALQSITRKIMIAKVAPHFGFKTTPWQGLLEDIPQESRCYLSNCVQGVQSAIQIGSERRFHVSEKERCMLDTALEEELFHESIYI